MNHTFALLAVAIPTKNRPDDLDRTIETIFEQTVLPKQLIVVDQSYAEESHRCLLARCNALSPEVRESIDIVYIRDVSITGAAAARNRAIQALHEEIVLFLDDDVILEPNFIKHILKVYRERPEAAGVSGIITNYSPLPRPFRCWTRIFTRGPFWDDRQPIYWQADRLRGSAPLSVTRFTGCLMSFRTSAIRMITFDENLKGACEEDIDFCVQLWPRPLFIAPDAGLVHKQSMIGRSNQHWLYSHARANWYLYQRHWRRSNRARFYFVWLTIGYVVAALCISVHRKSLHAWADLRNAIHHSRGCISPNRLNPNERFTAS